MLGNLQDSVHVLEQAGLQHVADAGKQLVQEMRYAPSSVSTLRLSSVIVACRSSTALPRRDVTSLTAELCRATCVSNAFCNRNGHQLCSYRWVRVNPNVDNPNARIIRSLTEITPHRGRSRILVRGGPAVLTPEGP